MAVRESSIRRFNAHKDAMLDELWDMLESGHSSGRWPSTGGRCVEAIELVAGEYIENVTRILFDAFDTHYISSSHLRPGGEDEAVGHLSQESNRQISVQLDPDHGPLLHRHPPHHHWFVFPPSSILPLQDTVTSCP